MAYPRTGSELFVENSNKSEAVLGHPFFKSKYYEYEIAYKIAADRLIENAAKTDNIFLCVCIYPIAFLYRQFLELFLKDILWRYYPEFAKAKAKTGENLSGSHNLYLLWMKLREFIEIHVDIFPELLGEEPFLDSIEAAENLIAEMRVFDGKKSEKFRYPYSKTKSNHFSNAFAVDLDNLKMRIEELANFLTYIDNSFQEMIPTLEK